ncbi:MAG: ABC transporter permease [Caldilineaceae bacterium]|nr:ABC transporter permease [Caldilineaceae bacterium]
MDTESTLGNSQMSAQNAGATPAGQPSSGSAWRHLTQANWFPPLVIGIVIIVVWSLTVTLLRLPTYLLPSPWQIATEMVQNVDLFVRNGYWTIIEALGGFFIGGSLGLLLGVVLAQSRFIERGCLPMIVGATTVPIVAFAPLVVVYVGTGIQSKIVVAAIVSFFPLCLYTLKGLLSTEPVLRDLFYSMAASRWDVFFRLRVPTSLPYVFTAMKQTSTLAVISAIIAEYIQADRGLGYIILQSSYVMDIPRMWSAVVYSSLMAIAFYGVVALLERRFVGWHSSFFEQRQ